MLSGRGFKNIYNMSGGIRDWNKEIAVGPQDLGLHLFSGSESAEETIIIGFGLEEGLREFYLDMAAQVDSPEAKNLFAKLADIEIHHQEHLLKLYRESTGKNVSLEDFRSEKVQPSMEGGLTTQQYLQLYNPDLGSELDILSLALSIEAQALDLYLRAADRDTDQSSRAVLQQIANEERAHMARLAELIDTL
ncbi:MAG: ferritin family protein [Desulfobulbaceae bacterium]|uniref:Ferritin family protein n=1 Tax=Candidatus Desulfobia pelagia TaxID=2841692 RepID=A0A8J6TEV6_9BACT|nr:ferritin family protein [Candidatus Desulfobia pelagia]